MSLNSLKEIVGNIDIYLFDQLIKGRYALDDKILDAGCGKGRNIFWFYQNNFDIYGLDRDSDSIEYVKSIYPRLKNTFSVSDLNSIPFKDNYFNHLISNAVLHFAKNTTHFETMFAELIRVLKINGTLFIRMTSNIGIENKIKEISDGVYTIPDGSTRFLINKKMINMLLKKFNLSFLEPVKTVNVNDLRCMTTLVFKKIV